MTASRRTQSLQVYRLADLAELPRPVASAPPIPTAPIAEPHSPPISRAMVTRLVMVILEVLIGRRSVSQLGSLATDTVRNALARRISHQGHNIRRLRSMRISTPSQDVLEVAGTVECGQRVRAVAGRLEYAPQTGWQCTAFTLL